METINPRNISMCLNVKDPKSKSLCYNNAVGLHYIDDAKTKEGDRICGLLYRTTDVTTKRSGQIALTTKKLKSALHQNLRKTNATGVAVGHETSFAQGKRGVSKKPTPQSLVVPRKQHTQDFSAPERYEPPLEDATTVPIETIQTIEDSLSQPSQGMPEAAPNCQQEGGDLSHRPSFSLQADEAQNTISGPARHGPYSAGNLAELTADREARPKSKSLTASTARNPPYAILSVFDGCGSSVDIVEAKIGYRPIVCVLCEKDETLRYLAGKYGISVDHKRQHSSKGGGAFYCEDGKQRD